jgi:hypothetical protein
VETIVHDFGSTPDRHASFEICGSRNRMTNGVGSTR